MGRRTSLCGGPIACQKSLFDKLVDGGVNSPATATPSISFR